MGNENACCGRGKRASSSSGRVLQQERDETRPRNREIDLLERLDMQEAIEMSIKDSPSNLSSMGPEKKKNIALWQERLCRSSFQLTKIEKDGNCLFRALSNNDKLSHKKFRRDVEDWIWDNRDDVGQMRLKEWIAVDSVAPPAFKVSPGGDPEREYCDFMKKCGNWGGIVEIIAASELLDRNIAVLEEDANDASNYVVHYRAPEREGKPTTYMLYSGRNHYDQLNPLEKTDTYVSDRREEEWNGGGWELAP